MLKKALFLDRDGVLNVDTGYLYRASEWIFMDGIFDVLRFFKERGFLLVLVTNQSGISRGYYSERDFIEISYFMQHELKSALGFGLDKIYFCPHAPNSGCECRKPNSGMILRAILELGINPEESWMIGDKPSDIFAAKGAGVAHTILLSDCGIELECYEESKKPDFSVDSLPFLMQILRENQIF
ncbi:MAG: D-glycero-alpha-D-manno-heptose-1,7-bisphosphate 7-phosphatase [Wolinella sp.]